MNADFQTKAKDHLKNQIFATMEDFKNSLPGATHPYCIEIAWDGGAEDVTLKPPRASFFVYSRAALQAYQSTKLPIEGKILCVFPNYEQGEFMISVTKGKAEQVRPDGRVLFNADLDALPEKEITHPILGLEAGNFGRRLEEFYNTRTIFDGR